MTPARVRGGRAPRLNFPVTAEMIATAIPENSAHCMIADGLKAALPHARTVSVDLATIRYTDPATGRRYIYLTPAPAQVALLDFDHGRVPEPFTVKGHAAQIIEPREKPEPEADTSLSVKQAEEASTSLSDKPKKSRRRARLERNPGAGTGAVPIKVNGNPPPLGPMATGTGSVKTGPAYRTGKRRAFGIRVMGQ